MRINGLEEAYNENTNLVKHLSTKGWKRIGSGMDKTAFERYDKPNAILLVVDRDRGQKTFLNWVEFCKKHSEIEYLPRYSSIKNGEFEGEHYTFVIMEKLYKNTKIGASLIQAMVDCIDADMTFEEWIEYLSKSTTGYTNNLNGIWHNDAVDWAHPIGNYRSVDSILNDKEQVQQLKDFYNLVLAACEVGVNHGYVADLHSANIMMRADTTPVIIDPWID